MDPLIARPALALVPWDGRFKPVTPQGIGERARVYFDAMQDRHVPVTPDLAAGLARMEASTDPTSVVPWGRAYELAGQALGLGGSFGRTAFWATLTPVFMLEVAEPLLRKAALATGRVAITMPGSLQTDSGYSSLCKQTEAALGGLLETFEAAGHGFWSRAGAALFAAHSDSNAVTNAISRARLPARVARVLPGLVFEIEPERPVQKEQERKKAMPKVRSDTIRSGIRPREGGVDGIVHSRRLDEIGTALISTFVYPSDHLLVKLMDEGFLTTLRPPYRHPSRDLLSITLCEATSSQGPAAVVKAAWIDASIRLSFLLANLGRARSELGWCDVTDTGPICSAISMQGMQTLHGLDGSTLDGMLRRGLISRSTLMPAVFLSTPKTLWKGNSPEDRIREAVQLTVAESGRVANSVGAQSKAARRQRVPRAMTRPGDYSATLAFNIANGRDGIGNRITDWRTDSDNFRRKLDLKGVKRLRVAQLLLPQTTGPGEAFRAASDFDPVESKISADAELHGNDALSSLIGKLSEWFVEQTVRALDE